MTTPTRKQIYNLAIQRFMEHSVRNGIEPVTPTREELRENGFLSLAQSELMRDNVRHTVEELKDYNPELKADFDNFSEKEFDSEEALKTGCYISGTTGSGKSDLAMKHAEELMKQDVTVIVFDSTLDWVKRSSVPYYITVREGEHFQYSFDLEYSFIFDMSLLNIEQQKQLVKMACQELWRHQVRTAQQGKALHWFYLVFEEGHNYFPQGCMRSKEYAEFVQLVTGGRNFKIRFEVITQFASMIDKDVMKYMRQRYFGYTDEPNDTEYVTGFLGREYSKQLESLKAGQFLYKFGREVRQICNGIYESKTEPRPYPKLLDVQPEPAEPQEQPKQPEPQEPDMLQLAGAAFQIASLLVFLAVCAMVFLSW